jgi:hypothetical protein
MKTQNDYLEQLYEIFPGMPQKDIDTIVKHGIIRMNRAFRYKCDLKFINSFRKFRFTTSKFFYYSPLWSKYYKLKLVKKLRFIYNLKKLPKDTTTYYFALNEKQYNNIFNKPKRVGRPTTNIHYGNVMLYMLKEECIATEIWRPYIFKFELNINVGYKILKKNFITSKAEYIQYVDTSTIKRLVETGLYDNILKWEAKRTKTPLKKD